jgi:hypothetical protein
MATRYRRGSATRPRISVAAGKLLRGPGARKAFGPVFVVAASVAATKKGKRR